MKKLFYPIKLDVLKILPLMPAHPKDLYLYLCAHADFKTGQCWPSYRRILANTKINNGKAIKEAIDYLVELALIETWLSGQQRVYKVI